MRQKKFEWTTIIYEGSSYDVCMSMTTDEVAEIKPSDSEIDITPVMAIDLIEWMAEKARQEINTYFNDPPCRSMSQKERLIEGV